jgi:beta-glucosidase
VKPLFPFGFGLAYTHFTLAGLQARSSSAGVTLTITVTNHGGRAGTAVPQAYLTQPPAAGEPPNQLAAFSTVTLTPGQTRRVTLTVPTSAFRAYLANSWTTVPGTYTLSVGQWSADLPLSVAVAAP